MNICTKIKHILEENIDNQDDDDVLNPTQGKTESSVTILTKFLSNCQIISTY